MRVDGFDWDDGNWPKCGKHGVAKEEIESLFDGFVDVFPAKEGAAGETRYAAIGVTEAGRHVFLAFTLRQSEGLTRVRPISARFMHEKEIRHYERQKSSQAAP
jgi:uncharacterized DUF497 family protein